MSFFPPKSTRGIPLPCLAVLAGNPVDFELFSGSIKQGLHTGIKGVSLCCALWESCSCSLCGLSSLVCAPGHTCVMPGMGNLLLPWQSGLFLFLLLLPPDLQRKQKEIGALQRIHKCAPLGHIKPVSSPKAWSWHAQLCTQQAGTGSLALTAALQTGQGTDPRDGAFQLHWHPLCAVCSHKAGSDPGTAESQRGAQGLGSHSRAASKATAPECLGLHE